jgi:predicted nucleic acid-binding protein
MGKQLYGERLGRTLWATKEDEAAAFACLAQRAGQGYSVVDCLRFVLMDCLGIHEALALDKHFQYRFIATPGPR